ncbi:MAG TPA: phosphatase PAP2 family protein [Pyrinomonadaceae bacterium]|jgi:undecaprenyl-diphosphatase
MSSNLSKRDRTKAQVKNLFIWLQTLVGSILFFGLMIAVGALFFFAWLADEVLEGGTQAMDETVRIFVNGFASQPLTLLMNFVTVLGSTLFLSTVFVCVFIIFIRKNRKRPAILITITMAGAVFLNFVLKTSFARARPVPFFDTPLPSSYSFPSGHALFALCFYGVLAWIFASMIRKHWLKSLIWVAAVFLALLIGISRIYLGVHYPSDVIAGYAASIVWVITVISADYVLKNKNDFLRKMS